MQQRNLVDFSQMFYFQFFIFFSAKKSGGFMEALMQHDKHKENRIKRKRRPSTGSSESKKSSSSKPETKPDGKTIEQKPKSDVTPLPPLPPTSTETADAKPTFNVRNKILTFYNFLLVVNYKI